MGRPPKPNGVRIREGMRGHRPLRNEPRHAGGIPERPRGMSKAAARVWDSLVENMDATILRKTDERALAALAEDESLLTDAYAGLRDMAEALKRKAKAAGKDLPTGEVFALMTTTAGRQAMSTLRDLANRLIVARREFGLSPSSRCRVNAGDTSSFETEFDDIVFNRKPQLLVRENLN